MAKSTEANEPSASELVVRDTRIADEDLASITSLEDAVNLLGSYDAVIEDFSDYGTGFEIVQDKNRLVGVPFLIVEWRFTFSKQYGADFVSALVVTRSGEKLVINDGSHGMCKQLRAVSDAREAKGHATPYKGLTVKNGLKRSDYTTTMNVNGEDKEIEATTYYLA